MKLWPENPTKLGNVLGILLQCRHPCFHFLTSGWTAQASHERALEGTGHMYSMRFSQKNSGCTYLLVPGGRMVCSFGWRQQLVSVGRWDLFRSKRCTLIGLRSTSLPRAKSNSQLRNFQGSARRCFSIMGLHFILFWKIQWPLWRSPCKNGACP
jgi:hypothetical protein